MNNESISQVVPLWKISDVARYLRKKKQAIYKILKDKSEVERIFQVIKQQNEYK
jgi:hypothetical protein